MASLFALGRTSEILEFPPCADDGQRFIELITLTLAAWQLGDIKTCAQGVKEGASLLGRLGNAPNRSVYAPFLPYLDALIAYRVSAPSSYEGQGTEQPAYVIGDNHCLTAGHLAVALGGKRLRLTPSLVIGCKAWHLVRPQASPQRSAFAAAVARIPEGATAIVSLGEIDCRYREGSFPFCAHIPIRNRRALSMTSCAGT